MFADAFGHTETELTLQWVIAPGNGQSPKTWKRDPFAFDARFRQLQGKSD
jgi:hypothetical protein